MAVHYSTAQYTSADSNRSSTCTLSVVQPQVQDSQLEFPFDPQLHGHIVYVATIAFLNSVYLPKEVLVENISISRTVSLQETGEVRS